MRSNAFVRLDGEDMKAVEAGSPSVALPLLNLAEICMHAGLHEEAITHYDAALRLGSVVDLSIQHNLARLLATVADPRLRDPQRAVELARQAIEMDSDIPEPWGTLGVALYRTEEYEDAIDALLESVDRQDDGPANDWFFLAMAYWQTDRPDEAQEWYGRAVDWLEEHSPDDEELRRFRDEARALLQPDGEDGLHP